MLFFSLELIPFTKPARIASFGAEMKVAFFFFFPFQIGKKKKKKSDLASCHLEAAPGPAGAEKTTNKKKIY